MSSDPRTVCSRSLRDMMPRSGVGYAALKLPGFRSGPHVRLALLNTIVRADKFPD